MPFGGLNFVTLFFHPGYFHCCIVQSFNISTALEGRVEVCENSWIRMEASESGEGQAEWDESMLQWGGQ